MDHQYQEQPQPQQYVVGAARVQSRRTTRSSVLVQQHEHNHQAAAAAAAVGDDDHHHLPHPHPLQSKTAISKAMSMPTQNQNQQRRLDLEQEVGDLQKQLCKEEAVHDILDRALQQPTNSILSLVNIPAFIPTKTKELLAELVLVEEEIARLEAQIHTMKNTNATDNNTANAHAPLAHAHAHAMHHRPEQQPPAAVVDDGKIKSMYFISQAINGAAIDYLDRRLLLNSPKLTSRNSLDKQHNHRHQELVDPAPPKALSKQQQQQLTASPTSTRHRDHHDGRGQISKISMHPNKLSERIVKCLVCIFIRLLRSSRAAELLDKQSANLQSRSGNLHQLQGSFRIDAGLLNVAAAAAKDKDVRGQQDHYGIFGIQDSIVRDIGPYKNLVRFTSSSFDLTGFSTSPLLTKLRGMLEALQKVELRSLSHQQKLAFWINIYNTCIMHGILQHGLPSNSGKLLALKNKATLNVSGQKLNALVIENFILRQPSSMKEELWKCDVDVEEQQVRSRYGLNNSEPNILFALCCGIRSSPALRIYKADRVMVELEKAKVEYLQASLVVTSSSSSSTARVMIPGLIHSNMHDFAKDMESLLRWICEQLPTSWSLRKSMVECLRGGGRLKMEDAVDVIPYDYDFQYLLLPM